MARVISGLRFARSFVTPSGDATVSRELDFNLGARMAIGIEWVSTSIIQLGNPTTDVNLPYIASLHAENDTIEDLPAATGEDEDNIDTEVLHQHYVSYVHSESASGLGVGVVASNHVTNYPEPVLIARNPTFSGKSEDSAGSAAMALLMAYRYYELTDAELVGILTSRR